MSLYFFISTYEFQNEDQQPNVKCSLRSKPIIEKLQSNVFHLVNYNCHKSEIHRVDIVNFQI